MTDRRSLRRSARAELSIALHTGYRKALDSRHSAAVWNCIQVMDDPLYGNFISFVNSKLPQDRGKSFGWKELKEAAFAWIKMFRDEPTDELLDLCRVHPHARHHAQTFAYLLETQANEDWRRLSDWLGGRS